MRGLRASIAFYWVFIFKLSTTFAQIYMLSLIATNGSSNEPFLALKSIAHMAAWAAALRGVDALMDPVFQKLNPFRVEEKHVGVVTVPEVTSTKENP